MNIAIIGALDSVEKIYAILSREYKDVVFIKYIEDEIKKLVDITTNIDSKIDGIILTGVGVYEEISSKVELNKPMVYTKRGTISIVKTISEFIDDYRKLDQIRLGLDTVLEEDFLDVLEEFSIGLRDYTILDSKTRWEEEEYLGEYLRLYESGKINCVFTAYGHIYNYLQKKNIPVYRIQATNIDIKNTYRSLEAKIKMDRLKDRAIQVQIVELVGGNIKDYINKGNSLEKDLLSYAKEIEGMIHRTGDEFLIISNKGAGLSYESLESLFKITERAKSVGITLGVGIGEGLTLVKSESNSRNALRRSVLDRQSEIFYYDGELVIGPLMKKDMISYKNNPNSKILEISREIGISSQYVEKIISVKNKLGRDSFTSKELAELLSISERTSNRILKKIIDKGFGQEVGYENSLGSGRPRRIIKIKF